MTKQTPTTAAIEAAWLEINDDQKDDIMAYFRFFKLGYESAKAANELALQFAYESGKEAAEGNGWVRCEDRLPSESGIYPVIVPMLGGKPEVAVDAFHASNKSWTHYTGHIAWMLLPTYESTGE